MKKKFTIEAEMEERWIPYFMSMLKHMERLGALGEEEVVGIYSDGKVDFKPIFNFNFEFDLKEPTSFFNTKIYDGTSKDY